VEQIGMRRVSCGRSTLLRFYCVAVIDLPFWKDEHSVQQDLHWARCLLVSTTSLCPFTHCTVEYILWYNVGLDLKEAGLGRYDHRLSSWNVFSLHPAGALS